MAVLSIDLGGSHITCAVVQEDGIVAEAEMPTRAESLAGSLDEITLLLRHCIGRSGLSPQAFRGIAVAFCGVVDGRTGEILSTLNKYTDAPQIDLHAWAKKEFGLPLAIENDAALALLGEAYAGAARAASDVVMVTLGTGIGGAAMLGGKLLRSAAGQAGCMGGHLPVNFKGRRCVCGAIGCAESEASTSVLPVLCKEHPGFSRSSLACEPVLNFEVVFGAASMGDAVAKDIILHCEQVWSALTVGLIHAYGPELVIFGGGVIEQGPRLLVPIRRYVETHVWRTSRGLPRIELAQLGSQAALLGGFALFRREHSGEGESSDHA